MRLLAASLIALACCGNESHNNASYVDVAPGLPLVVVAQGAALLPGTYEVWQDQPIQHSRAIEVAVGDVNAVTVPWAGDQPCQATLRVDVTDPWIVADVLADCEK